MRFKLKVSKFVAVLLAFALVICMGPTPAFAESTPLDGNPATADESVTVSRQDEVGLEPATLDILPTSVSMSASIPFSDLNGNTSLEITPGNEINRAFNAPNHGVEFVNTWIDADTSNSGRLSRFAIRIRSADAIELRIDAVPGVAYSGYNAGNLTFIFGNQTLIITDVVLDIIGYAVDTGISHSIDWNLRGGNWETTSPPSNVYRGASIYLPPVAARSGYTFRGWFLTEELAAGIAGSAVSFPMTNIQENQSFYARWEEGDDDSDITIVQFPDIYNPVGMEVGNSPTRRDITIATTAHGSIRATSWETADTSDIIRLDSAALRIRDSENIEFRLYITPGVTRLGYDVGDLEFVIGSQTLIIRGMVLDIHGLTPDYNITHNVSWNLRGGNWNAGAGQATVHERATIYTPPPVVKSGYTFRGWFPTEELAMGATANAITFPMVDVREDQSFYARWEEGTDDANIIRIPFPTNLNPVQLIAGVRVGYSESTISTTAHGNLRASTWVNADTSHIERLGGAAIRILTGESIQLELAATPGGTVLDYYLGDLSFIIGETTLIITGVVIDITGDTNSLNVTLSPDTRGIGESTVTVYVDGVEVQPAIGTDFDIEDIDAGAEVVLRIRCDCNGGIRFDSATSAQVGPEGIGGVPWDRGMALAGGGAPGNFRVAFTMPEESVELDIQLEDLPNLNGVSITPNAPIELTVGETINLSSNPIPSGTQTRHLHWASDNGTIASVVFGNTGDGRTAIVTGLAPGTTYIRVFGSRSPGNWTPPPLNDPDRVEAFIRVIVAGPEPTPTLVPTATATPTPTATPAPTSTPAPARRRSSGAAQTQPPSGNVTASPTQAPAPTQVPTQAQTPDVVVPPVRTPANEFTTINDYRQVAPTLANSLHELRLLVGTGIDDSGAPIFELNRPLNRMEALALVIRLMGLEAQANTYIGSNPFNDTPEWGRNLVAFAYSQGITAGIGNGEFAADRPVTHQEFTAFLLRIIGFSEAQGDFNFEGTLGKSVEVGLFSVNQAGMMNNASQFLRSDAVLSMTNALMTNTNDTDAMLIDTLVSNNVISREAANAFIADVNRVLRF